MVDFGVQRCLSGKNGNLVQQMIHIGLSAGFRYVSKDWKTKTNKNEGGTIANL